MKKLVLIFLMASLGLNAQTSMSADDIAAQAGNRYETLLTNVEFGMNTMSIQSYLQRKGGMIFDKNIDGSELNFIQRFKKRVVSGEEEQQYFYVKMISKEASGYDFPITQKVEIWGDWIPVVKFFCGFWSRTLNFEDVKPGEVVSTRFLTDVATLTFPEPGQAKITVVSAKDR